MSPFQATTPGISGVETLLPLLLRLECDAFSLSRCLALVTSAPTRILGGNLGQLGVGSPADICVFDRDHEWEVERVSLRSQGKNTPYEGWLMQGKCLATLVGGRVVSG